jgi:cytochrome c-type biogenesis protein CcmH
MLFAASALAFTPEPPLPNAQDEELAQSLFHELRCVVCEGQSLAESDATLARQMRSEIRRMVREGQSKPQIIGFFQQRYGDVILMSPPLTAHTYLLWATPLLLLAIGTILLWRRRG